MAARTHADVPLSFFEYRAIYQEPLFDAQSLYWKVSRAVFQAFRPWNISLENMSFKQNPASFADILLSFSLFGGRLAFNVGFGSTVLVVKDPNWSEAGLIMEVGKAGIAAVLTGAGLVLDKQKAGVAMHLKPRSGSLKDFVGAFARIGASELQGSDVRAYGISVYKENSTWVVDASATYPDALFVRIDHNLGPEVTFEEIAAKLKEDEVRLLDSLQLEVD